MKNSCIQMNDHYSWFIDGFGDGLESIQNEYLTSENGFGGVYFSSLMLADGYSLDFRVEEFKR